MQEQAKKNVLRMPEELIRSINSNLPGELTIVDIQTMFQGRRLKVPFYMTRELMEADISNLDLTAGADHIIRRCGWDTIGEIVHSIDGSDDLKRLRGCGVKKVAEITGKLIFFQYSIIPKEKQKNYINELLELNGITNK